jgi:hypothetical protein
MTKAISVDESRLIDRFLYWSELHKSDQFEALLYASIDAEQNLQEAIKLADNYLTRKLGIRTDLQSE